MAGFLLSEALSAALPSRARTRFFWQIRIARTLVKSLSSNPSMTRTRGTESPRAAWPLAASDAERRLRKLEAKLGEEGEKPNWMRWRSYNAAHSSIWPIS